MLKNKTMPLFHLRQYWRIILICLSLFSSTLAVAESHHSSTNKGKTMTQKQQVKLNTTLGDIVVELDHEKAPKTVNNFVSYVSEGFYDGTIFHRVINNFMIQGGGFEKGMKQKPTKANIENEAQNGLKNDQYTIAMARTPDPHSASSQFFINVAKNDFLNFTSPTAQGFGYCVFGKVTQGTDIVDRIKAVKTQNNGFHQDVPQEDVVILKATVLN